MGRSYSRIPGFGEWSEERIISTPDGSQVGRSYTLSETVVNERQLLVARDTARGINLHFAIYEVIANRVVDMIKQLCRTQDELVSVLYAAKAPFMPAQEVNEDALFATISFDDSEGGSDES